ncbi:MAG: phosphatase PAP2 family protein [Candidatus Nanohaloarchaea archaeon]
MAEFNYILAEMLRGLTGINQIFDMSVVFLAEAPIILIPLILIGLYLKRDKLREDSLFVFTATVLSIGISYLVGLFYYQEAPFMIYDALLGSGVENSFPSQHAATMFTFAIALIYRNRDKIGYSFLGLAVLNGLARVIGGEHFPLDITVSAFLGLIIVQLVSEFESYIERFSSWTEELEDQIISKFRNIV